MNNVVNELSGYITIIAVIIGGILTFLGGFAGNLLLQSKQRKNDCKHLTATFAGDIFAILSIIKEREYENELKIALDKMKDFKQKGSKQRIIFRQVIFRRPIQGDYLMVYRQNVGKLGVLESSLAAKIVIFYTNITMLLDDNREVVETDENTADLDYFAVRHKETLNLLTKTVKRGEEVLKELNKEFWEILTTSNNCIDETHSTQSELTEGDSPVPSQNK